MQRRRADLKLGYSCNNNCLFCGEAGNRHLGDKSTAQLRAELTGIPAGASEIVLTGGEPTIRPDFVEILSIASRLFSLVQVQTNARMFSYPGFASRMSDMPNVQFFVSLSSHLPHIHDSLTQVSGSFLQAVAGIRNLVSAGRFVILNQVMTKRNFPFLPAFADFASGLGVGQLQFSFVHPIGSAMGNYREIVPRLSDVRDDLSAALDVCDSKGLRCLVEGVPPCLLPGRERDILEFHYRHSLLSPDEKSLKRFGRGKAPRCSSCMYDKACFGTWASYLEKEGWSDLSPVEGKPVSLRSFPGDILMV